MGDGLGSGSGQAIPAGAPQISVWGIDMREEVSEPQATETDNHLIGYLAMAEMISKSKLCKYCQTILAKHLINEDMAIHRPTHSGGFYEPNRHACEHWTTGTSIATFLGPHVVNAPPWSHLPTTSDFEASRNDLWAARNLACFRRRWLTDPAWRLRRLRGWLSRLCRPLTFRPAPVEGVPAGHNVWELKLWSACAGLYDLVDLAQGCDVREWARMARMHLVASESADLRGRCRCRDVDGHLIQDPARLAWYQSSDARAVEAWRAHEARTLQALMHPLLAEAINLQSGRRRLLMTAKGAAPQEDAEMEDAPAVPSGRNTAEPPSRPGDIVQAEQAARDTAEDSVGRVLVPATARLALNRLPGVQEPTTSEPLARRPEKASRGVDFEEWLLELWTEPGIQAQLARLIPKGWEALRNLDARLKTRENALTEQQATPETESDGEM